MSPTEAPDPSRQMLEAFREYLRREDWPLAFEDEEESATAVAVEGNSGRWLCVLQTVADHPFLVFSSVLPTFVPPERRQAAAEFLHRANSGMLLGGFQFDWDEGEVRFVTGLDLTGTGFPETPGRDDLDAMFRQVVYTNVTAVDRYLPALLTVLVADASPALAVEQAERD